MFQKLLLKLEDPEHPFLGPNLKSLHFWGILLPEGKFKRALYILMHSSLLIFAVIVHVDMWFLKSDFQLLLISMKYNFLTSINCVKIVTFLAWQAQWKDILSYVSKADMNARNNKDSTDAKIIDDYTKYCRKVTYLYWFLTACTVLTVILQPIVKYVTSSKYRDNVRNGTELFDQVLSHKAPFDYDHVPEYILAQIYTDFVTIYAGGLINSFDTIAILTMVFFKAELQMLRRSCSKIFNDADEKVVFNNLKGCQKRHTALVNYSVLFNSCLSPIMFLYMVVTSFCLCASVYQISIETSTMQRLLTAEYATFITAQLFFYCWHGNDVLEMSHAPMRGVYESAWWKRGIFRRDVILLTGQLDRRIYFTAGPFINLTLGAFINNSTSGYVLMVFKWKRWKKNKKEAVN